MEWDRNSIVASEGIFLDLCVHVVYVPNDEAARMREQSHAVLPRASEIA